MKIGILGDIHVRIDHANQILALMGDCDKIIFQNDIFDQFTDSVDDNIKAAIWLKQKLEDDKNIFLLSNHLISYQFPWNSYARCSGFTLEKSKAINQILTQEDWHKQYSFYVYEDILFTHAGLSKRFLDDMVRIGKIDEFEYTLENIIPILEKWTEKAYANYRINHGHPLFAAGYNRGGAQETGGIIWADLGEFETIPGILQIFGHSPLKSPTFKFTRKDKQAYAIVDDKKTNWLEISQYLKNGFGLDLDTHLHHYAVLENKELSIFEVIYNCVWSPGVKNHVIGKKFIRKFNL